MLSRMLRSGRFISAVSLFGAVASLSAQGTGAAKPATPFRPVVVAEHVDGFDIQPRSPLTPADAFRQEQDVLPKARACRGDLGACMGGLLSGLGATPAAVAAAKVLGGAFITGISDEGVIDIARGVHPFMANENRRVWLVNGSPMIIPAEITSSELVKAAEASQRAKGAAAVSSAFPGSSDGSLLTSGPPTFGEARRQGGGHTLYVFTQAITSPCHACAVVGRVEYGFEFDARGRALRKVVLRLMPAVAR